MTYHHVPSEYEIRKFQNALYLDFIIHTETVRIVVQKDEFEQKLKEAKQND